MFRPDWHRHSSHRHRQSGSVHFVLIGLILIIGVVIGLNWEKIKQVSLPDFAVARVQAARAVQNCYAETTRFFAGLNFWSKPDEGGVSVPATSLEYYLPGHVPADAFAPPVRREPSHTAEPAAQPLDHAH